MSLKTVRAQAQHVDAAENLGCLLVTDGADFLGFSVCLLLFGGCGLKLRLKSSAVQIESGSDHQGA
jgi:hypothetical protein